MTSREAKTRELENTKKALQKKQDAWMRAYLEGMVEKLERELEEEE